ncbi:hypothetical protein [Maribacter sp.]|uniref:hypothetical protein n=1 Tax=Maribacter sp. TaxID=1897614 RepID=UPI0025C05466|nr:hypothetical protein [Maribacter sp.]
MKGFKKILFVFFGVMVAFFLFLLWYQNRYSMDVAVPYAINEANFENKLLIATQGSDFKDEVTSRIVSHFKSDSIYIQVIDVEELHGINPKDFDALVIIHTWENWKPPVSVKSFINRTKIDKDKIVVLTTSGEGSYKMDDVDAIVGESILDEAPVVTVKIIERLNSLLSTKDN